MIEKIAQYIKLDKPLVIFDLEATGLTIPMDRIIEVAYTKLMPNGRALEGRLLLNPEIEILPEATEVHGITNEQVKNQPTFKDQAQELWGIFNDCYYSGYNVLKYDLPLLRREFLRIGMDFDYNESQVIDSRVIYQCMEPRTLSDAYDYYCGKKLKNKHDAKSDLIATTRILLNQLQKYGYDAIKLSYEEKEDKYLGHEKKFYWRKGKAYFAFSRYRDKAVLDVAKKDPDFLKWMLSANFSDTAKDVVKKALSSEDKE